VQEPLPPDRTVELAGLARRLEQGGIYNGSKLVRAILERELVRHADAMKPASGDAAAAGLDKLAGEAETDGAPALATALRAAAAAVREDTALALTDAPPAFTCRTCGELALLVPPDRCPRCEAPALAFREHLPVWYLEPMSVDAALAALADGPRQVEAAIAGHDEASLARAPRPGEWSARETLEHLVSAEELLTARIPRLLREDEPELVAAATWAETGGDEATTSTIEPASAIAGRYVAMRGETLALLRDLPESSWERPGTHPEWGRVTVRSQVVYFIRHQASHMAQLTAAAEGRIPGERSDTA
jgi:hypothetical protein